MTTQETPDPLGFLLSHPAPLSDPAPTGAEVARPAGTFPTRRELRMQREAEERAAAQQAESVSDADATGADATDADAVEPVLLAPLPAELAPVARTAPAVPVAPESAARESVALEAAEAHLSAPRIRRGRKVGRRVDVTRRNRTTRQRITGTATMLLVGGLFASLTLPAYALSGHTSAGPTIHDGTTQSLSVSAKAGSVASAARDGYGATSFADLRAAYTASIKSKNNVVYSHSAAAALGDDYPWYDALTRSQGGGLSPLRYYYRECVDFVAWRLNRDAGFTSAPFKWDWSTLTPGDGDATGWKSAWLAHGWATGSTPVAGAVAWFAADHVAYVNSVLPNGEVLLEEYNYGTDHQYDQRIIPASQVNLFLYAPPS